LSKQKCLIFGGGGFIGSHICENLLLSGYDVTVFDKTNFSHRNLTGFINGIKIIEGDFNNKTDQINALGEIDFIFHLVSSTLPASSNENPVYDVETNLISTLNLLEGAVLNKIKKIIFISSGGTVYGKPENIPIDENTLGKPLCSYGIIKKTIEDYLYMFWKLYGLDYFVFRLSNPYGERQNPFASQGLIPVFLNKIINSEPIEIWGDGSVIRDYIYIKDAVKALSLALNAESENKILNLSSGMGYSIKDIIKILEEVTGKNISVNYKKSRNIDVPVNILSNSLAKNVLKWQPETNIKDGIKLTFDYLLNSSAAQ
jgi:UDP-glucose 4-epimerase